MVSFDCFQTGPDDQGRRLDRVIRRLYPELPLSAVYRLFRTGAIRLAGKKARGAALVEAGDEILVRRSEKLDGLSSRLSGGVAQQALSDLPDRSQYFESLILERTPDLIFINKPKGLLTHGPDGLDGYVSAYFSTRLQSSLSFRPAPLHRLDRNTSGVLAVSASIKGARAFSAALRTRRIGKEYLALVDGMLTEEIHLVNDLNRDDRRRTSAIVPAGTGRSASTTVLPLVSYSSYSLVSIRISTGLTHQIRIQCASRGIPLSGDRKYGGLPLPGGYLLHCSKIELPQALCEATRTPITAPLPPSFRATLNRIFGPLSLDSEAFRRYP